MAKAKKPTPKELYWAKKQKEEQERAALLPPGLVNHGNTCFMNSVLQGLFATELLEDLLEFGVRNDRFIKLPPSHRSPLLVNGRGPKDVQKELVQQMPVGDIFILTLERAWRMRDNKERLSMSPKELLSRLGMKYIQYLDFRQQDAHEFFLHLLDCMRMEEFDIIKQRQPRPPHKPKRRHNREAESNENTPMDFMSTPEEDRLLPFVDMLWGGKFTSVLICETCKHVSHTYEEFDDLSLSISHDESKERTRDRLRSFAAKFRSPAGRLRDQDRPRPLSQPPSPAMRPITDELLEDRPEESRRRSFESTTTHDLPEPNVDTDAEKRRSEIVSNLTASGHDVVVPSANSRSKKGDVSFVKLGRRISAGMAIAGKWDLKGTRAEKEQKSATSTSNKAESDHEPAEANKWTNSRSSSPGHPKATSRPPLFNSKRSPSGSMKTYKPSLEAIYLNRLLQDASSQYLDPLAALRMSNPNGASASIPWTKINPTQSVEDCLKMFTSVEVLDGDNMFGCRNCWKIANGQAPAMKPLVPDEDSEDSSDSDDQQENQRILSPPGLDHLQSFSTPNLPPGVNNNVHSPAMSVGSSVASFPDAFSSGGALGLTQTVSDLDVGDPGIQPAVVGTTVISSKPPNHLTVNMTQIDGDQSPLFHIPSIAMNPASPDAGRFPDNVSAAPTVDSLRLPSKNHDRHLSVPHDDASSPSSDESERDETSGVSDGDTSTGGTSQGAVPRRDRSSIPRSKQVMYRRALKRYLIAQAPPLLVIHLKRFQQMSKSVTLFGNLKKLDDYVSFPEYLDIQPFLAPKKEDYGLGKGHLKGNVVEKGNREEDLPCVYRLYAVVVHIGNMLGGHYVAYTALPFIPATPEKSERNTANGPAKDSNNERETQKRQWCFISDSIVRLVSLEEVLKAKAYICMYERVK
ncbi:hypothetical protein BU17DRAFT_100714 [Hysterangium stoloniferum]|nr:hypothetical protein BU17DRAFT_100714 [Hysterangium stoloniferum]